VRDEVNPKQETTSELQTNFIDKFVTEGDHNRNSWKPQRRILAWTEEQDVRIDFSLLFVDHSFPLNLEDMRRELEKDDDRF
jgi:hypothetical protein